MLGWCEILDIKFTQINTIRPMEARESIGSRVAIQNLIEFPGAMGQMVGSDFWLDWSNVRLAAADDEEGVAFPVQVALSEEIIAPRWLACVSLQHLSVIPISA